MAKADLIKQAQDLGLEVNAKMTIADIQAAIDSAPESSTVETTDVEAPVAVAKAGKRSAKGIKEAEEKQAKIEKQQDDTTDEEAEKPKAPVIPTRSKLERRGKKYQAAAKLVEADKQYTLKEALVLLPKISTASFDGTAEMHVKLNVDPKQADQNIRDTIVLPAGTGNTVRVAAFVDVEDVATAKKAGADIAGSDEFLQQLDKGEVNFDVLIAKPQLMAKLGKYARLLGPKGLMPNPKSGTVTNDIEKAITEAKAGRVEYRVDEAGIVHVGFGKISFGNEKLMQNAQALISSLRGNKPASIKGAFIETAYVTATMGPSVPLDVNELISM